MAVKIKLKRLGKIRQPHYRIVVADSRTKRVGAQPTEAVVAILKVTGDWQRFKGLPGAEGTLEVAAAKPTKAAVFEVAAKEAAAAKDAPPAKAARVAAAEQSDLAAAATQQQDESAAVAAVDEAEAVVAEAVAEAGAEAEAVVEAVADAAPTEG